MDGENWRTQYEAIRPTYERLTHNLERLLSELLEEAKIEPALLEARTKGVDSFEKKTTREGKNYTKPLEEMSDLCGLRIVLASLDEVARVRDLLRREFVIDDERSVSKIEQLPPDRFGYLSEHYVVRLSAKRAKLAEWKGFGKLWAEIQVRTVLQHAWSITQYPLDYKSEYDIPGTLRRRLFRLSALFELADEELNQITRTAQNLFEEYKETIRAEHVLNIEVNADSLRAYVLESPTIKEWRRLLAETSIRLNQRDDVGQLPELAREASLETIREINDMLKRSETWGSDFLKDYFDQVGPLLRDAADFRHARKEVHEIPPASLVLLLLVANYPDLLDVNVLTERYGWTHPEVAVVTAKKHNPRFAKEAT